VCASIAKHFNWNVVFVRVAFIVSLAITGGLACWVYLAFWAVTPFNSGSKSAAQRLLAGAGSFFTTSVGPEVHASPTPPASDSNVASVD